MTTVWKEQIRDLRRGTIPAEVAELLPERLLREIAEGMGDEPIEELRIRRGRRVSVGTPSGTRLLRYMIDPQVMDELFLEICDGSLYAHRETVKEGYVSLRGGIRVGICGRAVTEGERVTGVYDVDSLNIRFPRRITGLGGSVCQWLRREKRGVLVYAPPGVGKTTFLRSVCMSLGGGDEPWRIAVVDSRGELGMGLEDPALTVDILTGYPRAKGVEIAARTMNPQLIVCDELGDPREAEAILALQNCGIPFLASAHAGSTEELLRREGLLRLHRGRVFGLYVGLRRQGGRMSCTETPWEALS